MEVARGKDQSELLRGWGGTQERKGSVKSQHPLRRAVSARASGKKPADSVNRDIGAV